MVLSSPELKPSSHSDYIVRMEHITRRFPGVIANDDVHLYVKRATFHALIGENGAGKSTLLGILYGRILPDEGRIFLYERDVTQELRSPADAIRLGIGLVSQHHALIPALTVLENILLGVEPILAGGLLAPSQALEHIQELAVQLGLSPVVLKQRVEQLSLATLQKVEILKALYRNAKILLLDEPTATLAPAEVEALFSLLHRLVETGTTVIFVTHKLREVMAHSEYITVLRRGRNAGDFQTSHVQPEQLLAAMLGSSESDIQSRLLSGATVSTVTTPQSTASDSALPPLLKLEHISVRNDHGALSLQDISLQLFPAEIVGVAGVDGSGQKELAEAIVGLRDVESGRIFLDNEEITCQTVASRRNRGIAYIPEDRHQEGLVLDFSVAENLLLGHELQTQWGGGYFLNYKVLHQQATDIANRYDVRLGSQGVQAPVRTLSGGNQQKIVIARALESRPCLLIAYQPTRGLDIGATRFVHNALQEAASKGAAILLFSLDLDEILLLAHRIVVLYNGHIAGILPRSDASVERIGHLMTGSNT
ncbi:nucleoside ABC transporter ATP-binding protein [Chthonomonas calidirosea]|uniref:Nucleoside ABC transporter ATP-binding protein n=2 Tax=Chthonomonas TaxID=1077265 RepID=S0EWN5_CHTCT|nr:nucleoside ABC transporter ATP-binding protein [Chthonomonas calidirosea T49]CEK15636.1 nucleoside ABC transporter ATP-binding protein [Chthonomonas calidirosea]